MSEKRCRDSSNESSREGFPDQGKFAISDHSDGDERPRKRGRRVSTEPCLTKNAQLARENRRKHKDYVESMQKELADCRKYKEYAESLEKQLEITQQQNQVHLALIQQQEDQLQRLSNEVARLRGALGHQTPAVDPPEDVGAVETNAVAPTTPDPNDEAIFIDQVINTWFNGSLEVAAEFVENNEDEAERFFGTLDDAGFDIHAQSNEDVTEFPVPSLATELSLPL